MTAARATFRHLDRVVGWVTSLARAQEQARARVIGAFEKASDDTIWVELRAIDIDRLKDVTDGRLRLGALAEQGYRTVADVLAAGVGALAQVPGVGEATARKIYAAAEQLRKAIGESLRFRIDLDRRDDAAATELLRALWLWGAIRRELPARDLPALTELVTLRDAARPGSGSVRRLFIRAQRRDAADAALAEARAVLELPAVATLGPAVGRVRAATRSVPDPAAIWVDFEQRSADYYGLLGTLVDLGSDVGAEGFLPTEIVDRVNAQPLDESRLTVSLRGYQAFGARFALAQRRVLIGDEMGLGKTVQALAVMAHLAATGTNKHFMVVCPASVLVNWSREIEARSDLPVFTLHGPDRDLFARVWARQGGVAVTTFETLRVLPRRKVGPALLVVDEAHYVKNPGTLRSQAVRALAATAERVLFLSGTPMENRVEEFQSLVAHLQPDIAARIDPAHALLGSGAFRQTVAPVYLRRNQQDVLTELPALVQVEEWEEFGAHDGAAYRAAVAEGNFMAMRKAAFVGERPAKLTRLLEIAGEALDNGHRVVVFSYFREVLDTVVAALGDHARGPITGSTPVGQRQAIVDEFSRAARPGVLACQIEAGGVGLNIQAASVVILCEPQVKPTIEAQAIARAHRMGQVRTVQVHRLLVTDSVDQRMLEILDLKQRLFDAYVRESDVALAPGAVDISEPRLARLIVEQEQAKLAARAAPTPRQGAASQ